jgi:hypothetical protein
MKAVVVMKLIARNEDPKWRGRPIADEYLKKQGFPGNLKDAGLEPLIQDYYRKTYRNPMRDLRFVSHQCNDAGWRNAFFNKKSMVDFPKCPVAPVTKIIFFAFFVKL